MRTAFELFDIEVVANGEPALARYGTLVGSRKSAFPRWETFRVMGSSPQVRGGCGESAGLIQFRHTTRNEEVRAQHTGEADESHGWLSVG